MSEPDLETVWPEAAERLSADPAFAPVVRAVGPVRMPAPDPDPFAALVRSIVHQQLAGAAAGTIHARLIDALGGSVRPDAMRAAPEERLRGAGLSRSKLAALLDLAEHAVDGRLALDDLEALESVEVTRRLTRVRGIGPWTADMFLLFHLRRPDVWPTGDLGVRSGLGRILGWDGTPDPRETELIGTGYRPWRSAAAWYCWRAVDPSE